jgi:hypothetical protein
MSWSSLCPMVYGEEKVVFVVDIGGIVGFFQ